MTSAGPHPLLHLRGGGTSVVIDTVTGFGPAIAHWGPELPGSTPESLRSLALAAQPQRVTGGLDSTPRLALLPTASSGWAGTPGIEGHRLDGSGFGLAFRVHDVTATASTATFSLRDDQALISATVALTIEDSGILTQHLTVTNEGTEPFLVDRLQATFPLPPDAAEILDTTGRHLRERTPQRMPLRYGTHLRESRRGRPGADATLLLCAGESSFGFERGLVHAIHVAWSGNHRVLVEKTTTGESFLAGGELYLPGEVVLHPGQSIAAPPVMGSWGFGLDALAHRFHALWRARPQHPRRPRPVTLNTWEAVYFDHDLDRLSALAAAAGAIGAERFVLDDGWFRGRLDDTAGLGDWYVDRARWPDGLTPLIHQVHAHGMEFGLWVEPEMVNLDSDLARAHPEWILRARTDLPPAGRTQHGLDLAHPDVYTYLSERLHALLDTYDIAYLKWDHNRDLVDSGDGPGGRARVHASTLALYRLIDELKAAHPGLEIESCASGGARIDLGILDRTDRVWISDDLDPLERLGIQRYTGLVVPPEMTGTHVTSPVVHTTGRTVGIDFSAAVALFGHFGTEWDLTRADQAALDRLAEWISFAKEIRPLVASGRVVHADLADESLDVRGIVSADGASAVFTISQVAMSVSYPAGRVRLPGLIPDALYRVRRVLPDERVDAGLERAGRSAADIRLTGAELDRVGIRPLVMRPQSAEVLRVDRVEPARL